MERYETVEGRDGIWMVIDTVTGDEVYETEDEWKARDWCADMNAMEYLESNWEHNSLQEDGWH